MSRLILGLCGLIAVLLLAPVSSIPSASANPLQDVALLAVSGTHSCVLMAEGDVKCWGSNGDGRLGDGTIASRLTPASVVGLDGEVVELVAGGLVRGRMCAVMQSNAIYCWGAGALGTDLTDRCPTKLFSVGSLGRPVTNVLSDTIREFPCSKTPERLTIIDSKVLDLAMGSNHTCALIEGSGVSCWGWNTGGQLGVPPYEEKGDFTDVSGLEAGVVGLTAGYEHSCALMEAGTVKCWGSNFNGWLGDGTVADSSEPVDVCWTYDFDAQECSEILNRVAQVVAGGSGTCAILEDGAAVCWGSLSGPREGSPSACPEERFDCYLLPAVVEGLEEPVVQISVQTSRACALRRLVG